MRQPMRFSLMVALFCVWANGLSAQGKDTLTPPPVYSLPDTSVVTTFLGADSLTLSAKPTVQELVKIFVSVARGRLDPFVAVPAVIGEGDSAVAALDSILFSDPIAEIVHHTVPFGITAADSSRMAVPADDTVRPNKLYAAMALEGIASRVSYRTLFSAAQGHVNKDVRGVALRALGNAFHEAERLEKFTPDKELVHLLLSNVENAALVPYLQKSIGQISCEGLTKWLPEEFGEARGDKTGITDAVEPEQGTSSDYWEAWWRSNSSNIIWDGQLRGFHPR